MIGLVERFVDSTSCTKSSYAYLVATNPGLTEGLLRMHEDEQAVVLLPSAYAFGSSGKQRWQGAAQCARSPERDAEKNPYRR